MRTVVSSQEVPHLWANQTQDMARNTQGNCSFASKFLFSYAAMIAAIVEHKGKTCVLYANHSWSNTTARHQSRALQACRHMTVFKVLHMPDRYSNKIDHKGNLKDYEARILTAGFAAARARSSKEWKINEFTALINQANAYAEFFGFKKRFKTDFDTDELKKQAEEIKRKEALKNKREEKKREILYKERLKEYEERLQQWKNGEDVQLLSKPYGPGIQTWSLSQEGNHLRIRGSRIETNSGAIVSVEAAKSLLPYIRAGKAWQPGNVAETPIGAVNIPEYKIDGFPVSNIDEAGNVTIGCHYLERAEIERVAAQLGV